MIVPLAIATTVLAAMSDEEPAEDERMKRFLLIRAMGGPFDGPIDAWLFFLGELQKEIPHGPKQTMRQLNIEQQDRLLEGVAQRVRESENLEQLRDRLDEADALAIAIGEFDGMRYEGRYRLLSPFKNFLVPFRPGTPHTWSRQAGEALDPIRDIGIPWFDPDEDSFEIKGYADHDDNEPVVKVRLRGQAPFNSTYPIMLVGQTRALISLWSSDGERGLISWFDDAMDPKPLRSERKIFSIVPLKLIITPRRP